MLKVMILLHIVLSCLLVIACWDKRFAHLSGVYTVINHTTMIYLMKSKFELAIRTQYQLGYLPDNTNEFDILTFGC